MSHAVLLIYDLLSVLFGRYAFANVFLWINESTEMLVSSASLSGMNAGCSTVVDVCVSLVVAVAG